jgi:hypothetical protein
MSPRERWIVYPLLFMTLGIAIRNQFLPTNVVKTMDLQANELTANTIRCNNLQVMDTTRSKGLEFGSALGDQMLVKNQLIVNDLLKSMRLLAQETAFSKLNITDEQGRPVIVMLEDKNSKSGAIQTMTADGVPQVQILSNKTGGLVLAIGHLGQVLAQFPTVGPPFMLSPSWVPPKPSVTPNTTPNAPPEQKMEKTKKEEGKKDEIKKEEIQPEK